MKDVFLNGGYGVNIIMGKLRVQLGLSKPKLAPYNLHIIATPLWGKCEDETRTPKSGNLQSFETPKTSEFNCKGQNTLP